MSIRGTVTLECDTKGCHAERVFDDEEIADELMAMGSGLNVGLHADRWRLDDDGLIHCPQCCEPDERDEAYERAAARARNNDFADTGGKDWT